MSRRLLAFALVLAAPTLILGQTLCKCVSSSLGLPADFFGNTQTGMGGARDITIPVDVLRLWDTNATWNFIETASNTYNFTNLDTWFTYAISIGATPDFVMGRTPGWAIPGGTGACAGGYAPNGCNLLPSDIGTTNVILPQFIAALANHIHSTFPGQRWIIEGLNEADLVNECAGSVSGHCSMANLVTYQTAIYNGVKAIDSTTLVGGPSASTINQFGPHLYGPVSGLSCPGTGCPGSGFLLAGGGAFMDFANFHPYFTCGPPNFCTTTAAANITGTITALNSVLAAFSLSAKPVAMSETNWGSTGTNGVMTDDQKVAYMGQSYLFYWDAGYRYVWWYQWDCASGVLTSCFGTEFSGGSILPIGTALGNFRNFMVGSTHVAGSGSADGNGSWTFPFVRSNGTPAEWIFNRTAAHSVSVPGFTTQFNLDGTSSAIVANTVTANTKPIMVN